MRIENQVSYKPHSQNKSKNQKSLSQNPNAKYADQKSDSVSFGNTMQTKSAKTLKTLAMGGIGLLMMAGLYSCNNKSKSYDDSYTPETEQTEETQPALNDEQGAQAIQDLQNQMNADQQRRDAETDATLDNIRQREEFQKQQDQDFENDREFIRKSGEYQQTIDEADQTINSNY